MVSGEIGRPGLTRREPRSSPIRQMPSAPCSTSCQPTPQTSCGPLPAVSRSMTRTRGRGRDNRGDLLQLAVFAAAPIDHLVDNASVATGLACDAGGDTGQGVASLLGNFFAAFDAFRGGGALGKSRAGVLHAIGDGVVNLVQDRAFMRPACRHWIPLLLDANK